MLGEGKDTSFVSPWDDGGEDVQVTVGLGLPKAQDRYLAAFYLLLEISWVKVLLPISLPFPHHLSLG